MLDRELGVSVMQPLLPYIVPGWDDGVKRTIGAWSRHAVGSQSRQHPQSVLPTLDALLDFSVIDNDVLQIGQVSVLTRNESGIALD